MYQVFVWAKQNKNLKWAEVDFYAITSDMLHVIRSNKFHSTKNRQIQFTRENFLQYVCSRHEWIWSVYGIIYFSNSISPIYLKYAHSIHSEGIWVISLNLFYGVVFQISCNGLFEVSTSTPNEFLSFCLLDHSIQYTNKINLEVNMKLAVRQYCWLNLLRNIICCCTHFDFSHFCRFVKMFSLDWNYRECHQIHITEK